MADGQFQEERTKEPVEEVTEERFLKDLYLFMKKRDTPIERIPHLGFKQIDLFLMFKTVSELGGYQQVTAQQLWKQVYNTLGGNPRSTSAATCTRRHYEKLLLPYECHVKGILINVVPDNQPKPFHYDRDDGGGQRPAKRRLLSIHQSLNGLHSDPQGGLYMPPPLLHYPRYYHPQSHTALPPYIPFPSSLLTPHSSPSPKPAFTFQPPPLNLADKVKEPLQQLRFLAEQYKTSSGLAEPLNLSVKASSGETDSNPVSSFGPPSSSKNPKFLNKPSTLYPPRPGGTLRNEGTDTQADESSEGIAAYQCPVKAQEAQVIDVEVLSASSSPSYSSAPTLCSDRDVTETTQKPASPKTDYHSDSPRPSEDRAASPEVPQFLSQLLPNLPTERDGKMEIEIPLSVFQRWLELCKSSAMTQEVKEPPLSAQEEQRNWSMLDVLPSHLMNPQHQSSAQDLRLRQKVPSPTSQMSRSHQNTSPSLPHSYKSLPAGGILKNTSSQDISAFDIKTSHSSKSPGFWDLYQNDTQSIPMAMMSPGPLRDEQVSTFLTEDAVQRAKPSAVMMMNSSSGSLLHLTHEEVLKLKKIISSSL
ncbi:AT-rich interaction domain 6 isoform X2 [Parambassis ranga]|nr:uncharacterized protein LOC114443729 isoform X2 [Parambassis ranga]